MQCGGIATEFTVPFARPCPRHLFVAIQAPYKAYLYQAALSLWHCVAGRAGVFGWLKAFVQMDAEDLSRDMKIFGSLEPQLNNCTWF